ncbi:TPA: hypothetical protein NIH76_004957 [Pseudomonas aeruginosa]|nr:hypothetical protein [Pseudomonas aeruginosa]
MSKELNKAPAEQAGGDERAACNRWIAEQQLCQGSDISLFRLERNGELVSLHALLCEAYQAGQARAALAQPSLMPPDRGPWHAVKWDGGRRVDLSSDDFEHDVALTVSGDFVEGDKFRYAQELAAWMNAHLAQPSPAQAEQAEAERPEVVAVMESNGAGGKRLAQRFPIVNVFVGDELMTVAQHERIVKAWIERWKAYIELSAKIAAQRDAANARLHEVATACATAEQERDAALAEVERLRESKGDPSGSFDRCMKMMYERDENAKRLDAALARVAELDKQCRDDVARALGLRPSQERGFAWSYLLASIKSCVKASEDAAQAQHSVPEEFSFEYRHPNGECHTVTVSREQVINEMPDFLFEALCSKFCNCEPVGETNVVECCCDEYAEEFKLIAAAPGKEVGHE